MSLEAISSAVPSLKETAAEIAQQTGADETFIREKVGISTRHILADDETGLGLAETACKTLFEESSLSAEDVGLVVYVTQNPDRRLPNNAPSLMHALGIPTSAAGFDLSLGCSGYVYGLSVVEAMLQAQGIDNALLVTCDPYSRIMAIEDKATNAVFGDAATCTWVRREGDGPTLSALDFGTDGSGADAIRVEAGGAAKPMVALTGPSEGTAQYDREAHMLHMDGRGVFNFVNSVVPGSINRSLEQANLTLDDVDWFALHQGSAYMLNAVARRVGISPEKLLMNIDRYANTVSSTIPLLLEDLMADRDLNDQRVLISGFGVGLSWGTGLLQF